METTEQQLPSSTEGAEREDSMPWMQEFLAKLDSITPEEQRRLDLALNAYHTRGHSAATAEQDKRDLDEYNRLLLKKESAFLKENLAGIVHKELIENDSLPMWVTLQRDSDSYVVGASIDPTVEPIARSRDELLKGIQNGNVPLIANALTARAGEHYAVSQVARDYLNRNVYSGTSDVSTEERNVAADKHSEHFERTEDLQMAARILIRVANDSVNTPPTQSTPQQ